LARLVGALEAGGWHGASGVFEAGGRCGGIGKIGRNLSGSPAFGSGQYHGQVYLGNALRETMNAAEKRRESLKDEYLSVEHFLLGLLDGKSEAARQLGEASIDAN